MKKQEKNKENSKQNIEPMGVDEFKFILNKMRLKQNHVVAYIFQTNPSIYSKLSNYSKQTLPLFF